MAAIDEEDKSGISDASIPDEEGGAVGDGARTHGSSGPDQFEIASNADAQSEEARVRGNSSSDAHEKAIKEMKAEIKHLTDLVLMLTSWKCEKVNENKTEKKNEDRDSFENDDKIKSLKNAHSKDTPKPEQYDMDPKGMKNWYKYLGV